MSKFWSLLEKSVIVQSSITFLLVCAVVYLYVTEKQVPEALLALLSLVMGFWFGTKAQQYIHSKSA